MRIISLIIYAFASILTFVLFYFEFYTYLYVICTIALLMTIRVVINYVRIVDEVYDIYDSNEYMKTYINNLHKNIKGAYNDMIEIDNKGWFQNEDEVGYVFKKIKQIVDKLRNDITELNITDTNE